MARGLPNPALAAALRGGLAAALFLLPSAPAPAQDRPGPTTAEALEARYSDLKKQAEALALDYKRALAVKVESMARENATLMRLKEAGLFTVDSLIAGVPLDDPLMGLPYVRKAYEGIEETAQQYAKDFASVAKEKNEERAVALLKKIIQAQNIYREEDRDGNGILDYAETISALAAAGLSFPGKVTDEVKQEGYRFRVLTADPLHWAAEARPEKPGETGDRFFFVNETGIIRAQKGAPANAKSEPVK